MDMVQYSGRLFGHDFYAGNAENGKINMLFYGMNTREEIETLIDHLTEHFVILKFVIENHITLNMKSSSGNKVEAGASRSLCSNIMRENLVGILKQSGIG